MAHSDDENARPRPVGAGPDIAQHGREKIMEEHRARREGEPAAAPLETDAESGGASAVSGLPDGEAPRDPAKPYLEARERGETSAQSGAPAAPASPGWLKWVIAGLLALAALYAAGQL